MTLIPKGEVYSVSLVCLSMKGYGDYYVVNVTNYNTADERKEFDNLDEAVIYYRNMTKEYV